jgi:hypothetical protein
MAEITTNTVKTDSYQTAVMASREAYRKSIVQKRYDKFFKKEESKAADVIASKMSGGKTLALLALAQKHPGIRMFFLRVSRFILKKGLRNLDQMVLDKDLEKTVMKFNRSEATVYMNTLGKLGFPRLAMSRGRVVGFFQETVDAATKLVKKPRIDLVISKGVKEALDKHMDFLTEESFFQKAHAIAKQNNIISRSPKAREWYHDYAAEYGANFRSGQMMRGGGKRISDVKLGRMYFFRYTSQSSASGRDILQTKDEIYDAFPLVFCLAEYPNLIEAFNFHYIEPALRAQLLGKMFMYLNNEDFNNKTKLFASKFRKVIQDNRLFRHAKAAYKTYKPGRIRSKILEVHPLDWELAIMLPTERFITPDGARVSSKKIWFKTKKLAKVI